MGETMPGTSTKQRDTLGNFRNVSHLPSPGQNPNKEAAKAEANRKIIQQWVSDCTKATEIPSRKLAEVFAVKIRTAQRWRKEGVLIADLERRRAIGMDGKIYRFKKMRTHTIRHTVKSKLKASTRFLRNANEAAYNEYIVDDDLDALNALIEEAISVRDVWAQALRGEGSTES